MSTYNFDSIAIFDSMGLDYFNLPDDWHWAYNKWGTLPGNQSGADVRLQVVKVDETLMIGVFFEEDREGSLCLFPNTISGKAAAFRTFDYFLERDTEEIETLLDVIDILESENKKLHQELLQFECPEYYTQDDDLPF